MRQDVLTDASLDTLDLSLTRFHHYPKIFQETNVHPTGFSPPCQHSLTHYCHHIEKFGVPNGLSSSITKSKHITAVKKPWRQSSRYEALNQMLTINTWNDKLAAARNDFSSRGMLSGTCLSKVLKSLQDSPKDINNGDSDVGNHSDCDGDDSQDLDVNEDRSDSVADLPRMSEVTLARKPGEWISTLSTCTVAHESGLACGYPLSSFWELGRAIQQENLEELVWIFLFYQQNPNFTGTPPISACPTTKDIEDISVFHSVKAIFCAPSNPSGIGGLYREMIRSTPKWKTSSVTAPHRDCVLLKTGPDVSGVSGLEVARVRLFFSFTLGEETFECALIHKFCKTFTDPDPDNGLWVFEPGLLWGRVQNNVHCAHQLHHPRCPSATYLQGRVSRTQVLLTKIVKLC